MQKNVKRAFYCDLKKTIKLLLMMKFILLLLIVSAIEANSKAFSQEKINISLKHATIKKVLSTIERTSAYRFIYTDDILPNDVWVDLNTKNATLTQVLNKTFLDTKLIYKILSNNLVAIGTRDQSLRAIPVKGKIVDSAGNSLQGVSVKVKGSTIGTITDANGLFSLNAPNDAVLVISYIGYQTKEVSVNGRAEIDIILKQAVSSLNQLVVVGYGTQRKKDLTGSVSTVDFSQELVNRPITNASQALGGKVTGLWVSQNSGQPGSDEAQLRVRGWGTLNNADPLVLIDGIEGSISEINPNDIKSITVLKDAASAAIYGSKAANGVILITTKEGVYNTKPSINFGAYYGTQSLGRRYDLISNSAEYMTLWNDALVNQGGSSLFPSSLIEKFKNGSDPYKYPNTNFFDYLFRNASLQKYNLSIRGGSANTKFYLSSYYLNQDGIMLRTNSKSYGLTLNLESQVKDWLTIGGRLIGTKRVSNAPESIRDVMYWFANGGYPFTAPYTKDGRFGAPQAIDDAGNVLVTSRNPLLVDATGKTKADNYFSKLNIYANISILKHLTFKTNFVSQNERNLTDQYNTNVYGYTDGGIQVPNFWGVYRLYASRNTSSDFYYTWFNTLNFDKEFGLKHHLSGLLGMQIENTEIKTSSSLKNDPPIEGLTQVDAGTSDAVAGGNYNALRMLSYFGRANYSLLNKYLFQFNVRADASSRFKEGNRWGVFPSVSAGWRLSEENFIKSLNIFSNLKLRASWGSLGNQNIGSYWPYLGVIEQNNSLSYNYGEAYAPGGASTSLVNENISWETTTTKDIGLDMGFLDNRLTIVADYFDKLTKGIIVQLPLPLVFGGIGAPYQNIGRMSNKGGEIDIIYNNSNADRNKFGYSLGINLTYVNNKVTKFEGGKSPDQLYLIREGYSYNTLYGYKAIGVFKTDAEADKYMHANGFIPKAGNLKYEDVNSDGRIDYRDKMALGNTIPEYTFGGNISLSYKGFDMTFQVSGSANVSVYIQDAWTQPLGVSGGTITKKWKNAWSAKNPNSSIPAIKINDTWDDYESSFWIHDISFLKLKNIQLSYTLPNALIERFGVQHLSLFVNAQNVFSLTNGSYEGFDPERNTFDTGEFTYPTPRIISFGINASF